MINIMMDRLFRPEDIVFVVCSGASLRGFDFNQLIGQNVIAVNDTIHHLKEFSAFCAIDHQTYEILHNKEILLKAGRPMYAVMGYHETDIFRELGVIMMKNTGLSGIDYDEGCVRFGGNSGYFALGMAIQLGAKDIRILGMDLGSYSSDDDQYFYGRDHHNDRVTYRSYSHLIPLFDDFARDLRDDIRVTNYSMCSAINVFPKKPLSEIFA